MTLSQGQTIFVQCLPYKWKYWRAKNLAHPENVGVILIWRMAICNALATALSALSTSLLVSSFPCKSSLSLKNLKSVTVAILQ